jgi:hypothetical protein
MHLAHSDEGPGALANGSECGEEGGSIALDRGARIGLREAEVEGVASIAAGVSALASREAVN